MKKLATLTIACALTLLMAGFAAAASMDHGSHGDHDTAASTMDHGATPTMDHGAPSAAPSAEEAMQAMQHNLELMKQDVAAMRDPAGRDKAMADMNGHMTDMHHAMAAMDGHAKHNGDTAMQASMKQLNKDMMTVMKGMGAYKKSPEAGIPMMEDGLNRMDSTMRGMGHGH
jgi:hypothetical protein